MVTKDLTMLPTARNIFSVISSMNDTVSDGSSYLYLKLKNLKKKMSFLKEIMDINIHTMTKPSTSST